MELNKIYCGDALEILRTFPDESIDCVITSPPYWKLRNYGTGYWVGGDNSCNHVIELSLKRKNKTILVNVAIAGDKCSRCGAVFVDKQIGLENNLNEYVDKIVSVFREIKRVLKKSGTVWLNIGDTYIPNNYNSKYKHGLMSEDYGIQAYKGNAEKCYAIPAIKVKGLKSRNLVGVPWRVALALQEDGWILRQDIIWYKPNCIPESVTTRFTRSHEYIFFLVKDIPYYFDRKAVMEDITESSIERFKRGMSEMNKCANGVYSGLSTSNFKRYASKVLGKLSNGEQVKRNRRSVWAISTANNEYMHYASFPEKLVEIMLLVGCPEGGVVLDPFIGSGTVAVVALKHNRKYVGIDLNGEYVEIANKRIKETLPMYSLFSEGHGGVL